MHLIEKYALNYNLKIDKPFIFEKFYPIGETKYISLHLGADGENARYPFWQEVINLSLPILQKSGINFIQSNFNSPVTTKKPPWRNLGFAARNYCLCEMILSCLFYHLCRK